MGEYDYRPGTGENFGFEYEDQMIAYLATAACNQKELKHFWIASNIVGLGAWDDVVIYMEYQNGEKKLHFLQLKHRANIDSQIKFKECKEDLKKYARDYEEISSLMSSSKPDENQRKIKEILNKTGVKFENFEFILMTNVAFKPHSRLGVKSKDSFIKTNIAGPVYQVSPNKTDVNAHRNFLNQFFIFSKQSGVSDNSLLKNIEVQLEHLITHTNFKSHTEVANCLPTVLKKWFLSKKQTLSITDAQQNISSCILSALKISKPINSNCPILDQTNWNIFEKLIKPYQLVVYSDRELTLANFFYEHNRHYFIDGKMSDVKFVINCINTANNVKVIMLVPNEALESITCTDISILNLLNALPIKSLALLNNYDIYIQGRKTKFETILNEYSDVKNIFRVDDVINLLRGKLCICKDDNFLHYYIKRSIPQIFVDKSIIFKMNNSFFIIIMEDSLVESEKKVLSYMQSKSNEADTRINFQCVKHDAVSDAKLNVHSQFNSVHVLKYYKNNIDFLFEWLSSSDNIKEVKKFIVKDKYDVQPMGDNLADFCWNIISKVIIVANPGMGKTYLLKYFARNFPVDSWVILLILNEIDFNKNSHFQSWLEEFYTKNLNASDKKIYELYLRKKSVVVLFDGFDEVAHGNILKALNLIKEAVRGNFKIVVTSREVTKSILEENLNAMAYTLNPFSKEDKQNFLEYFYFQNNKNFDDLGIDVIENRIHVFASTLLKNCSISNWDEEFTGVPLQCRLLAEGFIQECQNFCKSNDISKVPIHMNLISLYEKFIDTKFDIYWKEKEKIVAKDRNSYEKITEYHRNEFFSNHMDAAVQVIFPGEINISKEFSEEIKIAKEKHGIIIGLDGNNNPIFVHRTFAEYFAAKWLVGIKEKEEEIEKNYLKDFLKQYLKLNFSKISIREKRLKFMLEPQYNVVKDLFDRIVCIQCELHTAILNAELSKVRDIFERTGNRDEGKCGRNALHLISARGARHERIQSTWVDAKYWEIEKKEEEKYLEILELLLENSDWIEEEDQVLRWTPQQYADHRIAFGVIDRLWEFKGSQLYNLKKSFIKKWNKEEMLNMCCKYDYRKIGSYVVDFKTLDLNKTKQILEICAKNDSVQFAEKVIQSKELNFQQLSSMTSNRYYDGTYKEEGLTLLHFAAESGSVKILNVFLKFIDVNMKDSDGLTPLYVGCSRGHLSVVKTLVENGGNLFLKSNEGIIPIDRAVQGIDPNRELIEYVTSYDVLKIVFGEDINAPLDERYGRRALHYAAMGKNMSSLERLIAEGANVNIGDNSGDTALHWIIASDHIDEDIARYLIEAGLNIDAKNSNNGTALHMAIIEGNKESVELLLEYNANPSIIDEDQLTPLSLARAFGKNEIFCLLWYKSAEELRNERDVLHKSVLPDLDKEEVRKSTFVGFPQEVSHLVDKMSQSGMYYCGFKDYVNCIGCNCLFTNWKPSEDPRVKHAKRFDASDCQFLIEEVLLDYIKSCAKGESDSIDSCAEVECD